MKERTEQTLKELRDLRDSCPVDQLSRQAFITAAIENEEMILEAVHNLDQRLDQVAQEAARGRRLLKAGRVDVAFPEAAVRANALAGRLYVLLRNRQNYAQGQLVGKP